MSRVAILGSCITRDLWPVHGSDELLYVSRCSLASLMAPPIDVAAPPEPPPGLTRHQHQSTLADLSKSSLRRLVAFAPTHLVIDLIDERFDLVSVGDSLATESWEFEAGGYQALLPSARRIPRLSDAGSRLWEAAVAAFAGLVRASRLRHASIILHSARWAEKARDTAGGLEPLRDVAILPGRAADIAQHNRLLAHCEGRLAQLMPPMTRVEAPALRIADASHRWGLSPFHYVPEYYEALWSQLEPLGVRRPTRADATTHAGS